MKKINNLEKIKNLINENKYEKAQKLLIKTIDSDKLSDPVYLETVFLLYLKLWDYPSKYFLKYLKINKVPPNPINTNFDIARRFFYALYLLNKSGGMRLVLPYLKNIKPNRILEYRFLGGMYFYNYDFINSMKMYQFAFKMLPKNFSEIEHLHICGNLAACHLYLEDYTNYEKIKKESLVTTSNHPSIKRIFNIYDLLMYIQTNNLEQARNLAQLIYANNNNSIQNLPIFEKLFIDYALEKNDKKLIKNINTFREIFEKHIFEGKINPERYFALLLYIDSTIKIPNECGFIKNYKNTTYPYPNYKILGHEISDNYFIEKGNPKNENYLNFLTEEYSINGKRGIGLSNELKAIYYLCRADYFGLTFETLASLIYSHEDYAGFFLIRERIKQIIYRLKNHYHINVKSKNFRAYASDIDIQKIYISKKYNLRIKDLFTLNEFMQYYSISQSKAKIQIKKLIEKKLIISKLIGRRNVYKLIV